MICSLLGLFVRRKRFDVAYLGVAPWAHTILRDAILVLLAKLVSRRVWVHVHGDGLEKFTRPKTLMQRIVRRVLGGTELLAITGNTVALGKNSGIFSSVIYLPNFAKDHGEAKKSKSGPYIWERLAIWTRARACLTSWLVFPLYTRTATLFAEP